MNSMLIMFIVFNSIINLELQLKYGQYTWGEYVQNIDHLKKKYILYLY